MEKGNKVIIKNTDTIWDGKRATVIAEEDGQVEVRINFETEDGTKQVIEIFDEENLEMEREDESLNEETLRGEDALLFNINNKQGAYIDPTGKSTAKDKRNQNLDKDQVIKDLHDFAGVKPEKPIEESLNYEKTDDIIHPYVYLQDLDDKEIPAWNFASRIATAENVEEGFILKCAEDHKYKIFSVEAPSFFRTIIAAKEIKLEDIQEEYADFLQGNAVIYEIK